jgi:hypothetical protein
MRRLDGNYRLPYHLPSDGSETLPVRMEAEGLGMRKRVGGLRRGMFIALGDYLHRASSEQTLRTMGKGRRASGGEGERIESMGGCVPGGRWVVREVQRGV